MSSRALLASARKSLASGDFSSAAEDARAALLQVQQESEKKATPEKCWAGLLLGLSWTRMRFAVSAESDESNRSGGGSGAKSRFSEALRPFADRVEGVLVRAVKDAEELREQAKGNAKAAAAAAGMAAQAWRCMAELHAGAAAELAPALSFSPSTAGGMMDHVSGAENREAFVRAVRTGASSTSTGAAAGAQPFAAQWLTMLSKLVVDLKSLAVHHRDTALEFHAAGGSDADQMRSEFAKAIEFSLRCCAVSYLLALSIGGNISSTSSPSSSSPLFDVPDEVTWTQACWQTTQILDVLLAHSAVSAVVIADASRAAEVALHIPGSTTPSATNDSGSEKVDVVDVVSFGWKLVLRSQFAVCAAAWKQSDEWKLRQSAVLARVVARVFPDSQIFPSLATEGGAVLVFEDYSDIISSCIDDLARLRLQVATASDALRSLLALCLTVGKAVSETPSQSSVVRHSARTLEARDTSSSVAGESGCQVAALRTLCALYDEEVVDQLRASKSQALPWLTFAQVIEKLAAVSSGTTGEALANLWKLCLNPVNVDIKTSLKWTEVVTRARSSDGPNFPPPSFYSAVARAMLQVGHFPGAYEVAWSALRQVGEQSKLRTGTYASLVREVALSLMSLDQSHGSKFTDEFVLQGLDKLIALVGTSSPLRSELLVLVTLLYFEAEARRGAIGSAVEITLRELTQNSDPIISLFGRVFSALREFSNVEDALLDAALRGKNAPVESSLVENWLSMNSDARQLADGKKEDRLQEIATMIAGVSSYVVGLVRIHVHGARGGGEAAQYLTRALGLLQGSREDAPQVTPAPTKFHGEEDHDTLILRSDTFVSKSFASKRHRRFRKRILGKVVYLSSENKTDVKMLISVALLSPSSVIGHACVQSLSARFTQNDVGQRDRLGFVALLDRLTTKAPSDPSLWYYLGHFIWISSTKADSIRAFQNSLRLATSGNRDRRCRALSWVGLAACYTDEGKYEAAAKCYSSVVRELEDPFWKGDETFDDSLRAYCHVRRGELQHVRGRYRKAILSATRVEVLVSGLVQQPNAPAQRMAQAARDLLVRAHAAIATQTLQAPIRESSRAFRLETAAFHLSRALRVALVLLQDSTVTSPPHLYWFVVELFCLASLLPEETCTEIAAMVNADKNDKPFVAMFKSALGYAQAAIDSSSSSPKREKVAALILRATAILHGCAANALSDTRANDGLVDLQAAIALAGKSRLVSTAEIEDAARIHVLAAHLHMVLGRQGDREKHGSIALHHCKIAASLPNPPHWVKNLQDLISLFSGSLASPAASQDWGLRAAAFDVLCCCADLRSKDEAVRKLARQQHDNACFALGSSSQLLGEASELSFAISVLRKVKSSQFLEPGSLSEAETGLAVGCIPESRTELKNLYSAWLNPSSLCADTLLIEQPELSIRSDPDDWLSWFEAAAAAQPTRSWPYLRTLLSSTGDFRRRVSLDLTWMLARLSLGSISDGSFRLSGLDLAQDSLRLRPFATGASTDTVVASFLTLSASSVEAFLKERTDLARETALRALEMTRELAGGASALEAVTYLLESVVQEAQGARESAARRAVSLSLGLASNSGLTEISTAVGSAKPTAAVLAASCLLNLAALLNETEARDHKQLLAAAAVAFAPNDSRTWLAALLVFERSNNWVAFSKLADAAVAQLGGDSSASGPAELRRFLAWIATARASQLSKTVEQMTPPPVDSDLDTMLSYALASVRNAELRLAKMRVTRARKDPQLCTAIRILEDVSARYEELPDDSLLPSDRLRYGSALFAAGTGFLLWKELDEVAVFTRRALLLARSYSEEDVLASGQAFVPALARSFSSLERLCVLRMVHLLSQESFSAEACGGTLSDWQTALKELSS